MKIKSDYAQSEPLVQICKDPTDKHVRVLWMVKNLDGDVYPVELQMSIKGTRDLAMTLWKAANMLEDQAS